MMRDNAILSPLSFSDEGPCPYFDDGRISAIVYGPSEDPQDNFHLLLAEGYRRLGGIFYRNACRDCNACIPIRLDPSGFRPGRGQRRTLRKNADIRLVLSRPFMSREKMRLYSRYLSVKHGSTAEDESRTGMLLECLFNGYSGTIEMDYYLGDKLIAVGIVDEGLDALSSNYCFYDTDLLPRRIGIYTMLREIELSALLGKRYYYLGYYIGETEKMSYKKSFRPNEILSGGRWIDFVP